MSEAPATTAATAEFLRRWETSGAAERANYQLFLSELCDLLGVTRPEPTRPDDRDNAYVFERNVTFRQQGLVSVLRQLHDDLDAAVAEVYGWPSDLPDDEILVRLVALNAERAREEAKGVVRWLRPEYQKPQGEQPAKQTGLELDEGDTATATVTPKAKTPWPKTLPEQVQVIRAALTANAGPVSAEVLARTFLRARTDKVEELLDTLAAIGQAREIPPGSYVS